MRSFLPLATLLGVAFLLGCQDQGPVPVGPDGLVPQVAGVVTKDCAGDLANCLAEAALDHRACVETALATHQSRDRQDAIRACNGDFDLARNQCNGNERVRQRVSGHI